MLKKIKESECRRCGHRCKNFEPELEFYEPEVAGSQDDEQMYGKGGGFTPE